MVERCGAASPNRPFDLGAAFSKVEGRQSGTKGTYAAGSNGCNCRFICTGDSYATAHCVTCFKNAGVRLHAPNLMD